MSLYGKIFSSIYDGTLYGQWEAIVTFQQMIVLCDAEGYVDMTPQALAARTSIPIEIIKKGIEILSLPDEYSRSPECDGRRIELVDDNRPWGWRIVNHAAYRKMASAEGKRESDRTRIAAKRESERPEKGGEGAERFHVDEKSQSVVESRDVSRDVAEGREPSQAVFPSLPPLCTPPSYSPAAGSKKQEAARVRARDRFPDFWQAYPRKVAKADARRAWARRSCDEKADAIIEHVTQRAASDEQWLGGVQYIPYPATWINREGWLDEYAKAPEPKRHYL